MTKSPEDRVYLLHILERIQRIRTYTADGRESFFDSEFVQDAVIRNLEVIGEATKQLSKELRALHPEVPWRMMAGLRDILIHDYIIVNLGAIWRVVADELDPLETQLQGILAALNSGDDQSKDDSPSSPLNS